MVLTPFLGGGYGLAPSAFAAVGALCTDWVAGRVPRAGLQPPSAPPPPTKRRPEGGHRVQLPYPRPKPRGWDGRSLRLQHGGRVQLSVTWQTPGDRHFAVWAEPLGTADEKAAINRRMEQHLAAGGRPVAGAPALWKGRVGKPIRYGFVWRTTVGLAAELHGLRGHHPPLELVQACWGWLCDELYRLPAG